MKRLNLLAALAFTVLLTLPGTSEAKEPGKFGLGLGGVFNYTNTSNEVSTGDNLDNNTFFMRLSPRAEYFFAENVPVVFRAGLLTRSLDRGSTNATEMSGIFTVGSGYHLPLNTKLSLNIEAEIGGYIGSSERSVQVAEATVSESTDTRGFAFGGGLVFAYMMGENGQLRAGISYTGLVGNESVSSTDENLSATTHAVGLTLGYMFFF